MNDELKERIIFYAIDILFTHGLPALYKMIKNLNDTEDITIEDVKNIIGKINSESYFK
ncbi:MAG: hypothetical protein KAJ10_02915 [Thermodesulfovibrionia bacterium]|nr:hypothetical protein [Thermodesulfovibrionia bacterium]